MKKIIQLLMLIGLLSQTQSAFAAGFMIGEQSVSALGTAYASRTVGTDDATVVYANPAGMTSLCACNDSVFGGFYIMPHSTFKNRGSTNIIPPYFAFGQPYPKSSNGGQIGETIFVPNGAFAKKITNRLSVGLSFNAPFGLVTDYNDKWIGRYYATRSKIITVNLNPAIAFKINDCISIGAGFSAMYFQAELKNMVNFVGLTANPLAPAGLPFPDGEAKIKGNCWGFGGNVGILCKFNCDKTRLGVTYRSQVRQNLDHGRIQFKNVPAIAPLQAAFISANAATKITLPDTVDIGFSHQLTQCLTVYADFLWTHWGLQKALVIKIDGPLISQALPLKWKSVWQYCVGFKYQLNCQTALRAGYLYDQNPTPNSELRTARLPDQDRQVIACGIQYNLTDNLSVDLSYGHVFFKRTNIDYTGLVDESPYNVNGGLKGKYKTYADLLGAQLHITF